MGTLGPLAAKRATSTIPIVMTAAGDPLGSGLVASLARPGGNVTGMSLMVPDLGGKRLELLKELLPRLVRVAVGMPPIRIPRLSSRRRRLRASHWG
jgi:putative ABC transport system substrate-binding protein